MELIKPLIHPPIDLNESIQGYLCRLSSLNGYDSFKWLIEGMKTPQCINQDEVVELFIENNDWTGFSNKTNYEQFLCKIPLKHLSSKMRFCPICLAEDGIWKSSWRLQTSFCCTKHKIWLQEECGACNNSYQIYEEVKSRCKCEHELKNNITKPALEEIIELQNFIRHGVVIEQFKEQLMPEDNDLLFIERIQLVEFFARFMPSYRTKKKGAFTILKTLKSGAPIVLDVSLALLGGKGQFISFLKQLHLTDQGNKKKKDRRFKYFYRSFFKTCIAPCFSSYKEVLEGEIIFSMGYINARNSLFSEKARDENVWLPPGVAAKEFHISRKKLLISAQEGRIQTKVEKKGSREFILLFKADIQDRIYSFHSQLTLLDAAARLGTTKKRMLELCRADVFKSAIPPEKHRSNSWQICADEIKDLLFDLRTKSSKRVNVPICLPEFMQKYGNRCPDLFLKIIENIRDGKLDYAFNDSDNGLRKLYLEEGKAKQWLFEINKSDEFTINEASKILGIHQQFMYELVNYNVIRSRLSNVRDEKRLHFSDLQQFTRSFVLGTKIAEMLDIHPLSVEKYLAEYEVYPLHKTWKRQGSLRQNIYRRFHFGGVPTLYPMILSSLDWDFF